MHLVDSGPGDMVSRSSSTAGRSQEAPPLLGRRKVAAWLLLGSLCTGLSFLVTGCGTFTSRSVSDPGPAAARLGVGGSIGEEVDCLARPLIESGEIYGLAVGVLTPDGGTCTYGYGRTGIPGDARPPRGNTIFQIGSVSKVFVAALLALLVDEGALRYEDTVRSILPPEVQLTQEVGEVTLYDLVTNTGGFPREPFCSSSLRDFATFLFTGRNLYAYIDKPYLYHYLRKKHVRSKEQRKYAYSNIGFGLLAHLMEVKTGRPLPELLDEKICRPLGLRDTTFVLNEEQRGRLAVGHAGGQPRFLRRGHPMPPWDMGEIMRSSGGLFSTVNDLMIFAKANLQMTGLQLEPALAGTQTVQLHRPAEDVAFGWLIEYLDRDRLKVIYKQGVVAGYSGYIGMDTESRLAVVALYNTFRWDEKIGQNLVLRLSRGLALGRHHHLPSSPAIAEPPVTTSGAN